MAKIGMGEISPILLSLPIDEFLDSLTDDFKRILLPELTDKQIELELTKLYKSYNGISGTVKKTKSVTGATSTDTGESSK